MDVLYGPALPPGYVKPDDSDGNESERETEESAAKPVESSQGIIGPHIPAFLQTVKDDTDLTESNNMIGPVLPSSFHSLDEDMSSEEESYGPMPYQAYADTGDLYDTKAAIEKRAQNMRAKLDNKHIPITKAAEREEWMTVPDTSRKNQLSAISQCLAPPSKSSSAREKRHRHSEKDKKTSEELKKYNKSKRGVSLMELHKKDRKRKEKEKTPKERKAFDRDEIAVRHFSNEQVNSVVNKAKYLNSRFSAGNQQYL